jgi:phosphoglycolate phosphatase
MKNRFDLLIFDWDGTLINSIDWIIYCLQTAAREYNCNIPDAQAAKNVIGLSTPNAVKTLFPDADQETQSLIVAHFRKQSASKQLSQADFFPGVYDMLHHLKKNGYQLAVATGKSRAGLQEALEATGTENLFCITRCSDETASKPDPKMLHEIIQHTRTPKKRVLMIGDTEHDLQMALNTPISSIAVTCGAQSAEILQCYKPLMCLQQPTELLNFI